MLIARLQPNHYGRAPERPLTGKFMRGSGRGAGSLQVAPFARCNRGLVRIELIADHSAMQSSRRGLKERRFPDVATIVVGLSLAFAFGAVAHRLRMPPIVGYLLAGVAVGLRRRSKPRERTGRKGGKPFQLPALRTVWRRRVGLATATSQPFDGTVDAIQAGRDAQVELLRVSCASAQKLFQLRGAAHGRRQRQLGKLRHRTAPLLSRMIGSATDSLKAPSLRPPQHSLRRLRPNFRRSRI